MAHLHAKVPLLLLACFAIVVSATGRGVAQESFSSSAQPSAQLGTAASGCNDPTGEIPRIEAQTKTIARIFPPAAGGSKAGQIGRLLEVDRLIGESPSVCAGTPDIIEWILVSRIPDANKLADEVFASSDNATKTRSNSSPGGPDGVPQRYTVAHPGPPGANCAKGVPGGYDPSQNPNCEKPFVFKPMVPTLDEPLKGAVKTTGQGGGAAPLQAKATVAIASGPALHGSANVEDGGAPLGVLQVTIGKGWGTGHKAAGVVKTGTFSRASGVVEAFKDGTYAFRVDTLFYRDGSAARYVNFEIPMSR